MVAPTCPEGLRRAARSIRSAGAHPDALDLASVPGHADTMHGTLTVQ